MDIQCLVYSALATVGSVQILKNFFTLKNTKLWSIPTVIFSFGYCFLYLIAPKWIMQAVLVLCVSSLFYDTIYKALESLAEAIKNKVSSLVNNGK